MQRGKIDGIITFEMTKNIACKRKRCFARKLQIFIHDNSRNTKHMVHTCDEEMLFMIASFPKSEIIHWKREWGREQLEL